MKVLQLNFISMVLGEKKWIISDSQPGGKKAAQEVFFFFEILLIDLAVLILVAACGIQFLNQNWNRVPCIGSTVYLTTREVPKVYFLPSRFFRILRVPTLLSIFSDSIFHFLFFFTKRLCDYCQIKLHISSQKRKFKISQDILI